VLLVTGASQVGKTTLLQHICRNDQGYVTLFFSAFQHLAARWFFF
jgi:GTPase SAR1 family protein